MPKIPEETLQAAVELRRLPTDAFLDEDSCRIDEVPLGYLAVEIRFLGEPVAKLNVEFEKDDGSSVGPGAPAPIATGDDGRCYYPTPVPIGTYRCKVDGQNEIATITTVEDTDKPFILVLPFGRSYFDYMFALPGGGQ